jgi:hypothetical protein
MSDRQMILNALEPIIPRIQRDERQCQKLDAFIKEVITKIHMKQSSDVKKEEVDDGRQSHGIRAPPLPHGGMPPHQMQGGP